ncbi:WD40-repeat-containing domain protein [Radiomyces spectabilis]|uniref:WD40-repeat-containing domain protein n=1 Tax=Radiomyces spectabilis TaxID=64574 RepID=UPI00221F975C|nr:WD40-repeat-containing domain protein [Radiomyces spectabilis]KAI8379472.1 WD40-repeat-containing domain protein [Radiomyces spectabilis]
MDPCIMEEISPPATPPTLSYRSPQRSKPPSVVELQVDTHASPLATSFIHDDRLNYISNVKSIFTRLSARQQQTFIAELLSCCDNQLLAFVNTLIAPKLKIDFLKQLPIELALHVLSFIDDPQTLVRASRVSSFWYELLKDETTWKALCLKHHRRRRSLQFQQPISYREYFRHKHSIEMAWRKNTGKITTCTNHVDSGLVTSLQLDKQFIVIGCDNNRIEVFDSTTGRHIRSLLGHEGGVWALQFIRTLDPELQQEYHMLVSGGCDREARVWDLATGQTRHVLRGHTSTIRCLKILNPTTLITGSRDTTLRIWDIEHGTLKHVCIGHQLSVRCLDVHDHRVASGSYDATARLWDTNTGECLHVFVGHHSQIYAIVFDGQRVITGALDSTIRVWSAATGQCLATLHGHTSLVGHLQLSPTDASLLVSGGSDGCLRLWDLNHYECKHRISAHDNSVACLQFDDKRILSGGNDGTVKLWDLETGSLIRSFTQPAKTVWKLQFNDTKAVVVMQRLKHDGITQTTQTAIELHDFDPL